MSHAPLLSSPQFGKDFYYRAHPEDLKKFYAAVDEFHRIYDVVTEFESLNGLASDVMPGMCGHGGDQGRLKRPWQVWNMDLGGADGTMASDRRPV